MWGYWEPLFTCVGNINECCCYGKQYDNFSKNWARNYVMVQQFRCYILKGLKTESKGDVCTPTFITHGQKVETTWISIHGRTDKQNAVYPYAGLLFSLKKEILTHAATRMKLKDVMVSEMRQSQDKYCMIPLIWGT